MDTKKYIYWVDEVMYIGYLIEYPDYMTQGENIEELQDNLKDIYKELPVAQYLVFVKSQN